MSSGPIADSGRPPCPGLTVQSLILNTGCLEIGSPAGKGCTEKGERYPCRRPGKRISLVREEQRVYPRAIAFNDPRYLPVVRRAPFYVLVRPRGRREGQVTLHVACVQGLLAAPRNQPGPALTSYPIPNDSLASGRTVQLCDLGSVTYPVVTLRAMLGWGLGLGLKLMGIHGRI